MSKKTFLRILLCGLVLLPAARPPVQAAPPAAPAQERTEDDGRLAAILEAAAAYCERVKGIALHYVCREQIVDVENVFRKATRSSGLLREERPFDIRRSKRRTFSYDYQLIRRGEDLDEQRVLLEANGRKQRRPNADLGQLKYSSRFLIYGPVGFLSRAWQKRFRYALGSTEMVEGEPAVVVRAEPSDVREENANIGRIWINLKSQILRVEWEPASIEDYQPETLDSRLGPFRKTVVWTVDYGIEKNGVRFPSRQLIRELFIQETQEGFRRQALRRETSFAYDDYKFFTVETNVDLKNGRSWP